MIYYCKEIFNFFKTLGFIIVFKEKLTSVIIAGKNNYA